MIEDVPPHVLLLELVQQLTPGLLPHLVYHHQLLLTEAVEVQGSHAHLGVEGGQLVKHQGEQAQLEYAHLVQGGDCDVVLRDRPEERLL